MATSLVSLPTKQLYHITSPAMFCCSKQSDSARDKGVASKCHRQPGLSSRLHEPRNAIIRQPIIEEKIGRESLLLRQVRPHVEEKNSRIDECCVTAPCKISEESLRSNCFYVLADEAPRAPRHVPAKSSHVALLGKHSQPATGASIQVHCRSRGDSSEEANLGKISA